MKIYENLELEDLTIDGEVEVWVRLNEVEELSEFREWYWVSNFGRIKSVGGRKDKILRQYDNNNGYLLVSLMTSDGKQKKMLAHRLVAFAFISGYEDERDTVDHIFPDTKNNMASNLQWLSIRDNIRKEQSMAVIGECVITGDVIEFDSTRDAGRNGFHSGSISEACREKYASQNKHGGTNIYRGYKWSYKESA